MCVFAESHTPSAKEWGAGLGEALKLFHGSDAGEWEWEEVFYA